MSTPAPSPTRRALRVGCLQVAVAASTWGLWSLFLRPTGLSPWVTTPFVFVVMGLATLPLVAWDDVRPAWDRRSLGLLGGNAVLDAVNVVTFFAAMSLTTVAVAVLTHYLAPLLVALLAPSVDGVRVPGARWCAAAGVIGLALVLQPWSADLPAAGLLGALLGTVSAFAYAGNVFVARRLAGRIGVARAVSFHSLLGAALLLPLADIHGLLAMPPRSAALLVAGGALLGGGAAWLFVRGLRIIGSTRASMLTFLEPLVAVCVGWIAWREPLPPLALLGAALVLGAGARVTLAGTRTE